MAAYRTIVGPLLLVAGLAGGLILMQPDMGTALVIGCITMAILFASGVPMRPIVKLLGAVAVLALVVGLIEPYRRARLLSFLNPGAHAVRLGLPGRPVVDRSRARATSSASVSGTAGRSGATCPMPIPTSSSRSSGRSSG